MDSWLILLRTNFHQLDTSSQESIYFSYRELIYHDIYLLFKDHGLVEDVLQETFMKVVEQAPRLKDPTNIKAWIKKVARNTAFDFIKKNKKYRHVVDPNIILNYELDSSSLEMAVADQVEQQIRNEALHKALHQLNANYRKVLCLFYFKEVSYAEIAEQLQITEQAVAQMLVRARKKLFQYFSRKWGD